MTYYRNVRYFGNVFSPYSISDNNNKDAIVREGVHDVPTCPAEVISISLNVEMTCCQEHWYLFIDCLHKYHFFVFSVVLIVLVLIVFSFYSYLFSISLFLNISSELVVETGNNDDHIGTCKNIKKISVNTSG